MRVEYSKRAIADLRQIASYYGRSGNPALAERIAARIQEVVTQITGSPLSGRSVVQRPGVRVMLLVNYRYKIFYRVAGNTVRIIHIRHTSGGHTTAIWMAASRNRDIGRIWRVAEALEYRIGISEGIISTEIAPFGGMKESGIGPAGGPLGFEIRH